MNLQCSLPPAEALLIVSAVRRAMLDGLSDEAICALPALMRLPLEERARVVAAVQEHPDTLAMIARRQRIAKRRRWFPGFTDPRTGEISNLGCLLGCLLYIPGIPLVALGSARLAKPWIDRLVLNATFGPGKYEAGLRIVKKSFLLSDGSTLPAGPAACVIVLFLVSFAVPTVLYFALLHWIYRDLNEDAQKQAQ